MIVTCSVDGEGFLIVGIDLGQWKSFRDYCLSQYCARSTSTESQARAYRVDVVTIARASRRVCILYFTF